jgi:hypothetical protein
MHATGTKRADAKKAGVAGSDATHPFVSTLHE